MRGRFLLPFPTIHIIIPAVLALSASYFSGVSSVGDWVSYFALLVSNALPFYGAWYYYPYISSPLDLLGWVRECALR